MNRKDFFEQAFKLICKKGFELIEDNSIFKSLDALSLEPEVILKVKKQRPPGAAPEKQFLALCIGCDACMIACPVNAIMIEDLATRLPLLYPEKDPCIGCHDYPCINSCPTGALSAAYGTTLRLIE